MSDAHAPKLKPSPAFELAVASPSRFGAEAMAGGDDEAEVEAAVLLRIVEDAAAGDEDEGVTAPKTEAQRANEHRALIDSTFGGWQCNCALARAVGCVSCLDKFSKRDLIAIHSQTYSSAYPSQPSKSSGKRLRRSAEDLSEHAAFPVVKSFVKHSLHAQLWELKKPLPLKEGHLVDCLGRSYCIPKYFLNGTAVCMQAWRLAVGGTKSTHDGLRGMTMRGISPADDQRSARARRVVAVLDKTTAAVETKSEGKRRFAAAWWEKFLLLHDFMPNEERIVLRGPGNTEFWEGDYKPAVREAFGPSAEPLSYKVFMDCLPDGLLLLQKNHLPASDPGRLKVSRSARHSKFPECDTCASCRDAYVNAAKNPSVDPALKEECYNALKKHQEEWAGDRKCALALRTGSFLPGSQDAYEQDDKCGSFWQQLPVNNTGRETKAGASRRYHFAVQANVVCGRAGTIRFAFVPKNISTGGNFGLTNLMMALYRAKAAGRLGVSVKRLLRHTDGGPDNCAAVTHLLHYCLVYLGCFEEVLWFRFEAGHSHTEVAERLFGIMKRLFESDSNKRVSGIGSFQRLEALLRDEFRDCPENFVTEFNLANWDFDGWFAGMQNSEDDSIGNVLSNQFGRFTFSYVFRYEYVGEVLAKHGGVKVTYKDRLSYKGDRANPEWSPVESYEQRRSNASGVWPPARPAALARPASRQPTMSLPQPWAAIPR